MYTFSKNQYWSPKHGIYNHVHQILTFDQILIGFNINENEMRGRLCTYVLQLTLGFFINGDKHQNVYINIHMQVSYF